MRPTRRKRMRATRGRGVVLAALVLAAGWATIAQSSGCAPRGQRQTEFMRRVGTVTISAEELRVRTLGFAHLMMGTVESASDRIRTATDDPEIEEAALLWKVQMVPLVQEAAFRSDPLAALIDLWALSLQLRDLFTTGPGAEGLGDQARIARESTESLLERVQEIAIEIGAREGFEEASEKIEAWAEANPITGRYFVRTSVIENLEQLSDTYRRTGGLDAVGSLDERVRVMLDRLPFYTEYLPKQVVWQTELSLSQNADRIRGETGLAELEQLRHLDQIDASLAVVADFTSGAPDLIASERERTLRAVAEEIGAQRREVVASATDLAESQRGAVLDEFRAILAAEREAAVLDASARVATIVAGERARLLEDVERQRLESIESLRAERALVLDEARTIAQEVVDVSLSEGRALVDHAVWRLAQLLAVLGAAGGCAVLLAVLVLRRMWRAA